ncbi:hypothetical protein NKH18_49820 [Streptomyces sp. M10(2022)]
MVPVAGFGVAAVVSYAVAALLALACLVPLRRQHRQSTADVARLSAEKLEREAEAARRDADWHAYVRTQFEATVQEAEFLVEKRLPAALGRSPVPASRESGEPVVRELSSVLTGCSVTSPTRWMTARSRSASRWSSWRAGFRPLRTGSRQRSPLWRSATRRRGPAGGHDAGGPRGDPAGAACAESESAVREWPGQQWQKPLALVDVVRAASGRIVSFKRVEVTGDLDVGITAPVVEP